MPIYTFRNKKTGKLDAVINCTIAEMEQYEKDNPEHEAAIGMPLIHSGMGLKKPDNSFRDLLGTIRKGNSKGLQDSTINDFGGSSER
jgi:hypothetical protein